MTCKLCFKEDKLCNSHIIPEFFFKPLYDKQLHRYHVLSSAPERGNTYYPKGVRERLLCLDCEKLLSTYEKYANDVLFNEGLPKKLSNYRDAIAVEGLDYKKFKIFLLSILWRASVSKHPMFHEVNWDLFCQGILTPGLQNYSQGINMYRVSSLGRHCYFSRDFVVIFTFQKPLVFGNENGIITISYLASGD